MNSKQPKFILGILCLLIWTTNANAHPHAWLDMKNSVIIEKNKVTAFKLIWKFDQLSSAPLLPELKTEDDAKIVAQRILKNISGQNYLSELYDTTNNKEVTFSKHISYSKAYREKTQLVLEFILTLEQPINLPAKMKWLSYDPTYFVDMRFDNSSLISSPQQRCKVKLIDPKPEPSMSKYALSLDMADIKPLFDLGIEFAQTVLLDCQ